MPNDVDEQDLAWSFFSNAQFKEAFELYEKLAKRGDPRCLVMLGWMYETGQGISKDTLRAAECYEGAAGLGSSDGAFYRGRQLAVDLKYDEAVVWFERAAKQDFGPALFWLSHLHLRQLVAQADSSKGLIYLKRAARTGHFVAQRNLAVRMLRGQMGIWSIPLGALLFPWSIVKAFFHLAKDGYSERLIS